MARSPCRTGVAPQGLVIETGDAIASDAASAFAEVTEALFPAETLVRPAAEGGLTVRLVSAGQSAEAYRIRFAEPAVVVEASGRAGFLYGLITLAQGWGGPRLIDSYDAALRRDRTASNLEPDLILRVGGVLGPRQSQR